MRQTATADRSRARSLAALGLVAAACGERRRQLQRSNHHGAAEPPTTAGGRHDGRRRHHDRRRRHHDGRQQTASASRAPVVVDPIPTVDGRRQGQEVGLLFDVTGRGDKSFNDAAAAGLDKAKADFGVTGNESTPTAADGSDRPERIKAFVGDKTSSWPSASSGATPRRRRPRRTRTRSTPSSTRS